MRLMKRFGHPGRTLGRDPAASPFAMSSGLPATGIEIAPDATDPAIRDWLDAHYVVRDPAIPARDRLLLFLCGSRGIPARQRLITEEAGRMGFHAINLSYPNAWTVGGLCQDRRDPECHEQVRLDVFDGQDRSGLVRVGAANSILNRLCKLIVHLDTRFPEQGWARFLEQGQPRWSSLVLAGHSQGGGHAAVIAKRHRVARVAMFAAPVDHVRALRAHAAWLGRPGATPADCHFGFVHTGDPGFERILGAWELLGMAAGGPAVRVEDHTPPHGGSQRLVTAFTPVRRDKYHGCVVQDMLTPGGDLGRPLFAPVWRYLLGDSDPPPMAMA